MKKILLNRFSLPVIFILLLLCTSTYFFKNNFTSTKPPEDVTILHFGYSANVLTSRHKSAEKFAAWVSTESNGRLQIQLYPAEIAGSDKQMWELLKNGTLDMTLALPGSVAEISPQITAIELPFLFSSMDKVSAILDGPLGTDLTKDLPDHGLRCLAYWDNGFRQISNNKQPVLSVKDLHALKIRTPENKMTTDIFNAFSAAPAPLAWSEVYLALSDGSFDGQENPIANIYGANLQDVQKYLSILNYKYECSPFIINETSWSNLPSDLQEILKTGAVKYAQETRKDNIETENQQIAKLQAAGMIIDRPDPAEFRQAVLPVYEKWEPILGKDLLHKIKTAAN